MDVLDDTLWRKLKPLRLKPTVFPGNLLSDRFRLTVENVFDRDKQMSQ